MTIKKINIQKNIEGLLSIIQLPKSMENLNIPDIVEPENYMVVFDDNGNEVITEYLVSDISDERLNSYNSIIGAFSDSDTCQIIIDLEDGNKRLIINKSNSFIDNSKQSIIDYIDMSSENKTILDNFITTNSI